MTQQQGQGAAPGSKTFVHGTVTSVQFNFDTPKKAGGTYPACIMNYMDTQGQTKAEKWHMNIIDNPNNVELRNQLVQLHSAPGTQITIHKTKSQSGFWNVDKIDYGHVQGERTTQQAAPQQPVPGPAPVPGAPPQGGYPAPQPQAQPSGGWDNNNDKRRSKEDCMRGEAVQAAALLELAAATAGHKDAPKTSRMFRNADFIVKYIQGGIQEPVAPADNAAPGAPTAPPQPAPAPAAAQAPPAPPAPQAPAQAPQQAPAAPPPPPPAPPAPTAPPAAPAASAPPPPPAAAPGAPSEAPAQPQAQPQDFDDGFGGS